MYLCEVVKSCNINKCNWTKASSEDIDNYRHISEHKLADIVVPKSVNCTNCHCSLDNHTNEINLLCNTIIDSCVSAGKNCIPLTEHHLIKKSVPGWVEQIAPKENDHISRAKRAMFTIVTKSRRLSLPLDILFELFDRVVLPVVLYASEFIICKTHNDHCKQLSSNVYSNIIYFQYLQVTFLITKLYSLRQIPVC